MRICLVFDCLYPHTVGGAERWYRNLAEGVARRGHDGHVPDAAPVGPRDGPGRRERGRARGRGGEAELYADGRRSIGAQLRFGFGVFSHLVRHGGRYDVVQTPALHVSLLAVLAARPCAASARRRLVRGLDARVLARVPGRRRGPARLVGPAAVLGTPARALCFSRLHARRLQEIGHPGEVTLVEGLLRPGVELPSPLPAEPPVVFAGRHIPEKQATAIVPAVALARGSGSRSSAATIFGDGPDRRGAAPLIASSGLDGAIRRPASSRADDARTPCGGRLCHLFPSRREGYGLVVVEAAAVGTPTIVVDGPRQRRRELVEDGENGFVAQSAEPHELAEAIVRVHEAGPALRESTADWFRRNRARLSLETSVEQCSRVYGRR